MSHEQNMAAFSSLNCPAMAREYENIMSTPSLAKLPVPEVIACIVEAEQQHRYQKKLERLQRAADRKHMHAIMESIDYHHDRTFSKSDEQVIRSPKWLDNFQNILLVGPSSIGKSYLMCAIIDMVVRKEIPALYFNVSDLVKYLENISIDDDKVKRFSKKIERAKVIGLDNWAACNLNSGQLELLFEVVEKKVSGDPSSWDHTFQ